MSTPGDPARLIRRIPKPLVRVSGKPFLGYLLSKIRSMGIGRCILLTGYKHSKVKEYCGSGKKWGLSVRYSKEGEPLGTGGAIYNAEHKPASSNNRPKAEPHLIHKTSCHT